ncbi:hypothetical protein [Hanstruepera flava]|uniref:hypothetical protein n=1 Tax=Hanstruepera flava TaxID=2930218 RepID=UPI002028AD05|nr:hypothetical protein [Hanstruepera flava]
MKKLLVAFVFLFTLSTVFTGCRDEKGPSEKIEETAEEVGDNVEEAADEVGDAVEDVVDD